MRRNLQVPAREGVNQMRIFNRSIRRNSMGRVDGEAIGFGLAVGGGILAFAAVVSLLFVPTATISTLEDEVLALLGFIIFVGGWIVHALTD